MSKTNNVTGTVYINSRGQRYAVRKTEPGAYSLFWRSKRSGQWHRLPGYPDYVLRSAAEDELASLAAASGLTDTGHTIGDAIYWEG